MTPTRTLGRLAAAGLISTGLASAPALASGATADRGPSKRISICHATASASNPYVFITVAADAIVNPRTGEVEGHGTDAGTHVRDIIPAFSFTWGGRDYEYRGKNLDDAGAALLANRCRPVADDPGDPTGPSDPAGGSDDGGTEPPPGTSPGDDPITPRDLTPPNVVVLRDLDDVAPDGLGEAERPRSVDEASPTEAVLRVAIRPSTRRPWVGERVVFRVTGRSLGPAAAIDGTLCAAVPAGFSLVGAGSGMVLGRVICWLQGIEPKGQSSRSFVAIPRRSSAGRAAIAPASHSAVNAYRVTAATVVRPRVKRPAVAVVG